MTKINRGQSWVHISRFAWFWLGQMFLPFGAAVLVILGTAFIMLQISMLIVLIIGAGGLGAAAIVAPLAVRSQSSRLRAYGAGVVAGAAANASSVLLLAGAAQLFTLSFQDQTLQAILAMLLVMISHLAVAASTGAWMFKHAAGRRQSTGGTVTTAPADTSKFDAPPPAARSDTWEKIVLAVIFIVLTACIASVAFIR